MEHRRGVRVIPAHPPELPGGCGRTCPPRPGQPVSSRQISRASVHTDDAAAGVQRLTALLARAQRDLNLRVAAALAEEGCAPERWHALAVLADGAGHPMTELAEAGLLSPPTLTRLVDSMVADNLVYRKVDERDRRRVLVFATDRGRSLQRRIATRIRRRLDEILPPGMTEADLERLSRLLAALTTQP
jgi:DNA-binding MarR family transcriptional regulator